MLNIALPKGRLGDQVYELLASVGYDCKSIYDENRKLVFENPQTGVRYLLVKPSDVAIYVEHHAADVGIVGKDILMESNPDVYELLDLGLGKCRMCVAGKEDYVEDKDRPVRVATKFTNIAKEHYAKLGRDIDIIKLNGSIELAPILGLSDVIVDIVESGSTIRENHLKVLEEFLPISARFIANKSSFEFKNKQITEMAEKLKGAVAAAMAGGAQTVLMAHHGVVVCGRDKEQAMERALLLEEICRRNLHLPRTEPRHLPEEETQALLAAVQREIPDAEISGGSCSLLWADRGETLRAQLDDMAQMLGSRIPRAEPSATAILRTLSKQDAVFVRGVGAIIRAADPDDREALRLLTEKSALCALHTAGMGAEVRLGALDTGLMRLVYKKKYSTVGETL